MRTFAVAITTLLLGAANTAAADPETDYLHYCRGCHLADGSGVPPEVPTLIDELGPILALSGGREYIVRVPGVSQTDLNDEKLAAVLNWILQKFNGATVPKNFDPYTADFVAAARDKVLKDPQRYRENLLARGRTDFSPFFSL